jgi:hypothetical protein
MSRSGTKFGRSVFSMKNFMRNLVVLMMVLGMASLASASLQISVGGDYGVAETSITPGTHLTLDIGTTSDITPGVGEGYYALVATAGGTIDYTTGFTVAAYSADGGVNVEHSAPVSQYVTGLGAGEDGVGGGVLLSLLSSIPAGTIFDGIDFLCNTQGDTTLKLYTLDSSFGVSGVADTVVVHQIPEPVTIALFGLGGLLLRRRIA